MLLMKHETQDHIPQDHIFYNVMLILFRYPCPTHKQYLLQLVLILYNKYVGFAVVRNKLAGFRTAGGVYAGSHTPVGR